MDWPTYIHTMRRARGLRQQELAEALGVTQATVSRWEAGLSSPNRAMRERIRRIAGQGEPENDGMAIAFVRMSPALVALVDVQSGRFLAVSEGFCRLHAMTHAAILAAPAALCLSPEEAAVLGDATLADRFGTGELLAVRVASNLVLQVSGRCTPMETVMMPWRRADLTLVIRLESRVVEGVPAVPPLVESIFADSLARFLAKN